MEGFHFAHPLWLLGLGAIPLCVWLLLRSTHALDHHPFKDFVDAHLLPHLLLDNSKASSKKRYGKVVWFLLLWTLLMVALASPRWDYRQVELFGTDNYMVILLDLSQSMNSEDVKPSRLIRAKQEIEDILVSSKDIYIGLIAYAATPHMITPLTDDTDTVKHLLPSLETELIFLQGSRMTPALQMAQRLLEGKAGDNKMVLVISDGGFEDDEAYDKAKALTEDNIRLFTMGVGTTQGAPVKGSDGRFVNYQGEQVFSKRDDAQLTQLANAGGGDYLQASYATSDSEFLLAQLAQGTQATQDEMRKSRQWEERFYVFLIPAMAMMLLVFRRGATFPVMLLTMLVMSPYQAQANWFTGLFKNNDQKAEQAINEGEYGTAIELFDDDYRKGVAHYKAGDFEAAKESFSKVQRPEVQKQALYNLANTFVQQQAYEEAVNRYEQVLEQWPNYEKAKDNLALARQILVQQKEQQPQQEGQGESSQGNQAQSDDKQQSQGQGESNSNPSEQPEQQDDSQASKGDKQKQNSESEEDTQQNAAGEKSEENQEQASSTQESDKEQADQQEEGSSDQEQPSNEPEQQFTPAGENAENNNSEDGGDGQRIRTQKDIDADLWLNRIDNNTRDFLKNQFYIESQKEGEQGAIKPW